LAHSPTSAHVVSTRGGASRRPSHRAATCALRAVIALYARGHAAAVGRFRGWARPTGQGLGLKLAQHYSPIIFGLLFSFKIPKIHIKF
jgi:hypothetical protein